jgi:hypothetical protein
MELKPYISRGPDGRPCIRFRVVPKPQPCPQPSADFWANAQRFALLLTIATGLVSLFGD